MTTHTINLLDACQFEIDSLSLDSSHDEVAACISLVERLKALTKDLDAQMKEAVLSWVKVNGPIQIGDIRYFHKIEKKTTCPDNGKAFSASFLTIVGGDTTYEEYIESLLDVCGGDLSMVGEALSQALTGVANDVLGAGAIKPGAAKRVLGDRFPDYFKVEDVEVLDKEGKKVKKEVLGEVNEKFLPKKGGR